MRESHHQASNDNDGGVKNSFSPFLCALLFDDENRRQQQRVNEKRSHESLIATHLPYTLFYDCTNCSSYSCVSLFAFTPPSLHRAHRYQTTASHKKKKEPWKAHKFTVRLSRVVMQIHNITEHSLLAFYARIWKQTEKSFALSPLWWRSTFKIWMTLYTRY